MKILRTAMLFTFVLGCYTLSVTASAIPMWEFLSRGEKASYLLRMFSMQVAKYCADSSMPDCNKNLLVAGMRNLANMDNNILDQLDPYQRDAKGLIWRAMIKNAYFPRLAPKPDEFYFSIGTDSLAVGDSDVNGIGEETMATHDYIQPSSEHTGPYLVGPMVIRVYPDGRPVPEDTTRPLPRDEDMEEFRRSRVPSVEEIKTDSEFYEKQLKGNSFAEANSHRRSQEESTRFRSSHSPFKRRLLQEVTAKRKIRHH
ncbi:rhythmically expressed gene 5 protein isoform X1 [Bombus pyrosoma]|uniref:rhythmically expressed gene 5 protein isoform X1 n=2 Tax=Bombus pyrosoma TaxID=396416 RepID=UPI001CB88E0B|nr:rhythmically expressed gene 5 protein isoform X1 [Bombus pyrosoma]